MNACPISRMLGVCIETANRDGSSQELVVAIVIELWKAM